MTAHILHLQHVYTSMSAASATLHPYYAVQRTVRHRLWQHMSPPDFEDLCFCCCLNMQKCKNDTKLHPASKFLSVCMCRSWTEQGRPSLQCSLQTALQGPAGTPLTPTTSCMSGPMAPMLLVSRETGSMTGKRRDSIQPHTHLVSLT